MNMNEIICGDAVTEMAGLPDGAFKAIITSPPYNMRATKAGGVKSRKDDPTATWRSELLKDGYDGYDDAMTEWEYVVWQRTCLWEMMRLLAHDGAIFYNHKWRIQDGLLKDLHAIVDGLPVRQIIIWDKCGAYNFNETFFPPAYEVIYLIAKPGFKLNSNAFKMQDVWRIPSDTTNPHPASFPVAMVERIVSCLIDGPVLDPFMGSGTTAVAAERAGMDWVGIEQSQKYIDMANERIHNERAQMRLDI